MRVQDDQLNPHDKDFAHDPNPIYKQLRDEAPVYHCEPLNLARFDLRIVFEELFKRFPNFQVDTARATRAVLSNVRGVKTLPATLGAGESWRRG